MVSLCLHLDKLLFNNILIPDLMHSLKTDRTMTSGSKVCNIPLGPLDHIAPQNIPQSIIYLSLKQNVTNEVAFDCLREGLRLTVLQAPWLNGKVFRRLRGSPDWREGQLEIRYDPIYEARGFSRASEVPLRFNELPASPSFGELRTNGFALDIFDDDALLWTNPFEPDFESGAEVFAAQANFVPGGCLLVLSIAPPASDGTAMLNVTKLWADHCRSLLSRQKCESQPVEILPTASVDRAALNVAFATKREPADKCQATLRSQHVRGDEKQMVIKEPSARRDSVEPDARQDLIGNAYPAPGMRPYLFYMSQPMYATLRKELASLRGSNNVTGNDIICAFIWKSVIRAWAAARKAEQDINLDEQTTLAMPFDIRPNLIHLLPANYLGNLNLEHIYKLSIRDLIAEDTSIPWVAKMLRTEATKHEQQDALLEAHSALLSAQDYNTICMQIRASRMSPETASVGILSPMVLPFNDTCFGEHIFANCGRPEAFRPMMGMCNRGHRTCFVIPRKQHGGIEFVMTLSEDELAFLQDDDEFGRYAFLLS